MNYRQNQNNTDFGNLKKILFVSIFIMSFSSIKVFAAELDNFVLKRAIVEVNVLGNEKKYPITIKCKLVEDNNKAPADYRIVTKFLTTYWASNLISPSLRGFLTFELPDLCASNEGKERLMAFSHSVSPDGLSQLMPSDMRAFPYTLGEPINVKQFGITNFEIVASDKELVLDDPTSSYVSKDDPSIALSDFLAKSIMEKEAADILTNKQVLKRRFREYFLTNIFSENYQINGERVYQGLFIENVHIANFKKGLQENVKLSVSKPADLSDLPTGTRNQLVKIIQKKYGEKPLSELFCNDVWQNRLEFEKADIVGLAFPKDLNSTDNRIKVSEELVPYFFLWKKDRTSRGYRDFGLGGVDEKNDFLLSTLREQMPFYLYQPENNSIRVFLTCSLKHID